MYQIDNQKFGEFILQLRKEQNMTQREMAERLFVSDKTVSKWERGLSMPNVSLLIPIADVLGVTVTELLKGERIAEQNPLNIEEVEKLVTCSMDLSVQEQAQIQRARRKWSIAYFLCVFITAAENAVLIFMGFSVEQMQNNVILISLLMLLFGGWFCMFAKEFLPTYYDNNKINYVSDGFFRMDIPGIHFNNNNWPYILRACRISTLSMAVLFPVVYTLAMYMIGEGRLSVVMVNNIMVLSVIIAGFFLPIYIVGKKYE